MGEGIGVEAKSTKPELLELPELVCVLVVYQSGEECWEPMVEYLRAPAHGSFIKREGKVRDWRKHIVR